MGALIKRALLSGVYDSAPDSWKTPTCLPLRSNTRSNAEIMVCQILVFIGHISYTMGI